VGLARLGQRYRAQAEPVFLYLYAQNMKWVTLMVTGAVD